MMAGRNLDNEQRRLPRTAFVTIGATAGFRSLIREVVSDEFLHTLKRLKFTDLIVQCGPDLEYFETIKPQDALGMYDINITAFSYAPDLDKYFTAASRDNGRDCGVIISHAGPSASYTLLVQ
jgi:beta-1,4-N-acetylglucosaminyltransferase